MELGFLLDKAHYDQFRRSEWLEGQPESSFWTGLKTKGRDRFPVRTNRCTTCGYLESFAGDDQPGA
jgi:uncharacterized Fe-S cluster-containing MiaB family protein